MEVPFFVCGLSFLLIDRRQDRLSYSFSIGSSLIAGFLLSGKRRWYHLPPLRTGRVPAAIHRTRALAGTTMDFPTLGRSSSPMTEHVNSFAPNIGQGVRNIRRVFWQVMENAGNRKYSEFLMTSSVGQEARFRWPAPGERCAFGFHQCRRPGWQARQGRLSRLPVEATH